MTHLCLFLLVAASLAAVAAGGDSEKHVCPDVNNSTAVFLEPNITVHYKHYLVRPMDW